MGDSLVKLLCLCVTLMVPQNAVNSDFTDVAFDADVSPSLSCATVLKRSGSGTWSPTLDACPYPNLFSKRTGICEYFTELQPGECNGRTVPLSPCDYPVTNCSRPERDLCVCNANRTLNYDTCLSRPGGNHAWPGHLWTGFYIRCHQQRTEPETCHSGNGTHIFSFIDNKCRPVIDVVNQAYNMHSSISIPAHLRTLIYGYIPETTSIEVGSAHISDTAFESSSIDSTNFLEATALESSAIIESMDSTALFSESTDAMSSASGTELYMLSSLSPYSSTFSASEPSQSSHSNVHSIISSTILEGTYSDFSPALSTLEPSESRSSSGWLKSSSSIMLDGTELSSVNESRLLTESSLSVSFSSNSDSLELLSSLTPFSLNLSTNVDKTESLSIVNSTFELVESSFSSQLFDKITEISGSFLSVSLLTQSFSHQTDGNLETSSTPKITDIRFENGPSSFMITPAGINSSLFSPTTVQMIGSTSSFLFFSSAVSTSSIEVTFMASSSAVPEMSSSGSKDTQTSMKLSSSSLLQPSTSSMLSSQFESLSSVESPSVLISPIVPYTDMKTSVYIDIEPSSTITSIDDTILSTSLIFSSESAYQSNSASSRVEIEPSISSLDISSETQFEETTALSSLIASSMPFSMSPSELSTSFELYTSSVPLFAYSTDSVSSINSVSSLSINAVSSLSINTVSSQSINPSSSQRTMASNVVMETQHTNPPQTTSKLNLTTSNKSATASGLSDRTITVIVIIAAVVLFLVICALLQRLIKSRQTASMKDMIDSGLTSEFYISEKL